LDPNVVALVICERDAGMTEVAGDTSASAARCWLGSPPS